MPGLETNVQPNQHKGRLIIILGALSAFGPLSIDMYLPGLPAITHDLSGPTWQVQLTLTACILGLASGQILAGPLSDTLGRKRPLLIGVLIYAIASLLCVIAPSVPVLIGLRLIQGLAGAAGIVIARAMVRDLYIGAEAARYFALTMTVNGLAPILAPIIGGQLLNFTSWRGVFLVLSLIGVGLLVAATFGLQETLPPTSRRTGGIGNTLAAFADLFQNRYFMGYALASGLAIGAMFAYIAGSPFVLEDIYHVSPQLFSLMFAINACGIVVTNQISARMVRRFGPRLLLKLGLAWSLIGGLVLLLAILTNVGLIGILPGFFMIVSSIGLIGPNATALALADQRSSLGSASALIGVMQYIMGAAVTPFVSIGGPGTALPLVVIIVTLSLSASLVFLTLTRSPAIVDAL